MKRTTVLCASLLAALVLLAPFFVAAQCNSRPIPLEKRVAGSERICLGKLVSQSAYEGPGGNIFTINTIAVSAWLKGHSTSTEVGLITRGGFLVEEGKGQVTEPSLQLDPANEYILFLQPDDHVFDNKKLRAGRPGFRQCFATEDFQGALLGQFGRYHDLHFPPAKTEAETFQQLSALTGQPVLKPNGKPFPPRPFVEPKQAETVTGFSPATTNGGTVVASEFVTITGSGFGASPGTNGNVFFKNVDNGGTSEIGHSNSVSDYTNWSDNSITVEVPQKGGSSTIRVRSNDLVDHISAGSLTVNYGHGAITNTFLNFSNATRQRYYFRNFFTGVGHIFMYNNSLPTASESMSNNPSARTAFERALTTWRCGTGWNAVANGSASTSAGLANDGINSVMFVTELAGSTVGTATSRFSATGFSGGCDMANTVWWLTEVDVEMELAPNGGIWNYTGTNNPNFEGVAAHELGHGHGLQHVMPTGQLMSWISIGSPVTLYPNANELAGANARMAYSTVPTCGNLGGGIGPMTPVAPGVCSAAVLPVELMRFHCEARRNSVRVLWATATETNNDRFEIERSTDGEDFQTIGQQEGQGSSVEEAHYFFDDERPALGINYYRLKQVDYDGKTNYSAIESAFIRERPDGLTVSPNPAFGEIFIDNDAETAFRLVNALGTVVTRHGHAGGQSRLEVGGLPTGVYILMDENSGATKRVVIRR